MTEKKYNLFLLRLIEFDLNYGSLLYSNGLLYDHLTNPVRKECLNSSQFIYSITENPSEGAFKMDSTFVSDKIKQYADMHPNESSIEIHARSLKMNAHFIRTRTLNAVIETMKHFLNKDQLAILHKNDWFQVLYVLRNIASHYDGGHEPIKFPRFKWLLQPYPNKIEKEGIVIIEGQMGNEVRYNDMQLIKILSDSIKYFISNRDQFINE